MHATVSTQAHRKHVDVFTVYTQGAFQGNSFHSSIYCKIQSATGWWNIDFAARPSIVGIVRITHAHYRIFGIIYPSCINVSKSLSTGLFFLLCPQQSRRTQADKIQQLHFIYRLQTFRIDMQCICNLLLIGSDASVIDRIIFELQFIFIFI